MVLYPFFFALSRAFLKKSRPNPNFSDFFIFFPKKAKNPAPPIDESGDLWYNTGRKIGRRCGSTEPIQDADFRKEIKSSPRPCYLFFGEEDYLKARALELARSVICPDPSLAAFNDIRLDALDFTPQQLLDAITAMPMMAERKIITLTGLNFGTMKADDLAALCDAVSLLPDYDYNTLILSMDAAWQEPDRKKPPANIADLLDVAVPVRFARCTTAKLLTWIKKHFDAAGIPDVTPEFCAALAEYCGHDMFVLSGEIDKCAYYLLANHRAPDMEAVKIACTPANEYSAYAFTDAIMSGDRASALSVLADYKFRRVDPLMTLGNVISVICNMITVRYLSDGGLMGQSIAAATGLREFQVTMYQKSLRKISGERLKTALAACLAADASMKLSSGDYRALETLICSI